MGTILIAEFGLQKAKASLSKSFWNESADLQPELSCCTACCKRVQLSTTHFQAVLPAEI